MKSVKKVFGLFVLTAIYCCAIGMGLNTDQTLSAENQSHSPKESISSVSAKLYCHTSESETTIDGPSSNSADWLEGPGKVLGYFKASERTFESKITQYTRFSKNLLISYRKTDIIFPFHYFW
ncbi:hypothetical protein [Zobellia uliginosa]|uniref:hypothetical protein n=1 Tax=Zobellia uliginosa TaxID=143224 RepID=UPI0026E4653B|nr:hypothetical protein [Zobellia uliginosa]MDO6518860.1 hypothetical protein [Zobellia uliginosa]